MKHKNGDGGAHARPAILTPAAHSSQQLLDELLELPQPAASATTAAANTNRRRPRDVRVRTICPPLGPASAGRRPQVSGRKAGPS
jgi:hypothetical protein